jgi:hypothetical protein
MVLAIKVPRRSLPKMDFGLEPAESVKRTELAGLTRPVVLLSLVIK